jgi:hypothetical protein
MKVSWLGSEVKLYLMTLSVTSLYSIDVGEMRMKPWNGSDRENQSTKKNVS